MQKITRLETNTAKEYEDALKKKLAPFNDVPIIFISATEKTRIFKAMETALEGGYTRKDLDLFIDTVIRAEGISVKNMTPEEANQFVEKMKEGNGKISQSIIHN